MVKEHPLTFIKFDFDTLKIKFLGQFLGQFLKYPATIGQHIRLSYNIMEFTDGIYIISTDTFISYKDKKLFTASDTVFMLQNKFIRTVNYYHKTYKHHKKPHN